MDRSNVLDINFPTSRKDLDFESNLSDRDIRAVRAEYLEYAYRAMARYSRGSVLIQDAKVVTREMIETVLVKEAS